MNQFLWTLEYLSIDILSKNIVSYSKTPTHTWKLRYINGLGDKIILSSISNSFLKMDEKCYEFILENFFVKKFQIFRKLFLKIEYFDFLNKKYFEEFHIELLDKIKLRYIQNFKLTVDKLVINEFNQRYFTKNYDFLSKLYVKKELVIYRNKEVENTNFKVEKMLLTLLENTSVEIENIEIFLKCETVEFLNKLSEIIMKRKYLKKLFVNFDKEIPNVIRIFPFSQNLMTFPKVLESPGKLLLSRIYNEFFDSFQSISYLSFNCKSCQSLDEIENLFLYLESLNLNSLKEIEFQLPFLFDTADIHILLEKCPNLEKLSLSGDSIHHCNIIDSKTPCLKTLKNFKLFDTYWINMESLKISFSHLSLEEIHFEKIYVMDGNFCQLLKCLENFYDTLTTLKIYSCNFSCDTIEFFTKILKNFQNLECFEMKMNDISTQTLSDIFKSLQTSSKTLRKLTVKLNPILQLKNCCELFHLLDKCEKLINFVVQIRLMENKIPELLTKIRKFQNYLEKLDLNLCYNKKNLNEIADFLSGCAKLTDVFCKLDNVFVERELEKSLKNSRYSLKYYNFGYQCSSWVYPHCFMES